jgi:hypothetical protein
MKTRIVLIGLLAMVVVASAALRGCWDFTKPDPWVTNARPGTGVVQAPAG